MNQAPPSVAGSMPPAAPPSSTTAGASPSDVLHFWLGDGVEKGWPEQKLDALWFGGGEKIDSQIKTAFGPRVTEAVEGGLQAWENPPLTRLALVILLDQFTRNVFRGTARAFEGDPRSQALVTDGLSRNGDRQLPWVGRVFFYMPLMHAEDPDLQDLCVEQFAQLRSDAPAELKERFQGNLEFAKQHRNIISRFGRFPYRNKVLGRESSQEEQRFLVTGPRFGQ